MQLHKYIRQRYFHLTIVDSTCQYKGRKLSNFNSYGVGSSERLADNRVCLEFSADEINRVFGTEENPLA